VAREQHKLAAILAADVVGYSRLTGRDECGTLAALKALRQERKVVRFQGGKADMTPTSCHFRVWHKCEVPTVSGDVCCWG
jgi:hypothetical protein